MRAPVLTSALLVLLFVPDWTGEERLALLGDSATMTAERVALDPADPKRTRIGSLEFLGGVALKSRDPAFGGFSAVAVSGDRFTLLSDGGNIVRFRMGRNWRPHTIAFANLPAGPATGWEKRDRDSESMTIDPHSGRIWVGFERTNAIWRYTSGLRRGEGQARPAAMQRWPSNGGAESMVRMADGRFVVIGEVPHVPQRYWRGSSAVRLQTREALLFAGDPLTHRAPAFRFAYIPTGRYDPADMAALPNGDLLVVEREFRFPLRFATIVSRISRRDIAANRMVRGRPIATIESPLIHDNFEGIAVTREGAATILWLVSDDNNLALQRSLLLKFRLTGG